LKLYPELGFSCLSSSRVHDRGRDFVAGVDMPQKEVLADLHRSIQ
jgi:hypothetical protein